MELTVQEYRLVPFCQKSNWIKTSLLGLLEYETWKCEQQNDCFLCQAMILLSFF